jgi:hypothetical protein
MTKYIVFTLLISVFTWPTLAQSNPTKNFSLSLSLGPAFPVGVFAQKDIGNAVIYFPQTSVPNIASISKSNNGFAKVGYSFYGALNYKFSNPFYTFLRAGIVRNPISVSEMEDFVSNLYGVEFKFSHVSNTLFTITPGLGYALQKDKWEFRVGLFLGYGQINYPYYEMERVVDNERLKLAHSGLRPNLRSITFGGIMEVNREIGKFNVGLELLYQRADFNYSIFPKTSPGGSQSVVYDDLIKARILSLGLVFGYKF